MATSSATNKKLLKDLTSKLKKLQDQLVITKRQEGKDDYVTVKVHKDGAYFDRIKTRGEKDKAVGNFLIVLNITAKKDTVYLPLSIASSQKPTGFMYQIEGTGEGKVMSADVGVLGDGVTQVTVGTLRYTKIPATKTATFRIKVSIRGNLGKTYKIILHRINYKLSLTDTRYQQYLKPIVSDSVKFS